MPTYKRVVHYYTCVLLEQNTELSREWGQTACVYALAKGATCPKDCEVIAKYRQLKKGV